jgi:solute carrier family 35 protein E3
MDPREPQELQELPKYEAAEEPLQIPLKEKLITSLWIFLNTISTLGLVFLSKRYEYTCANARERI